MNKQKALERLREIEKEKIKNLLDFKEKLINDNNFNELNCFNGLSMSLIKEARKIKDDWEDWCGKKFVKDNCYNTYCGEEWNCPTCEKQNKEEKEICGRILG